MGAADELMLGKLPPWSTALRLPAAAASLSGNNLQSHITCMQEDGVQQKKRGATEERKSKTDGKANADVSHRNT